MATQTAPLNGRMTYGKSFRERFGGGAIPAYDETRACAKCGAHTSPTNSYAVHTEYDAAAHTMIRTCGHCGYKWQEMPKDA